MSFLIHLTGVPKNTSILLILSHLNLLCLYRRRRNTAREEAVGSDSVSEGASATSATATDTDGASQATD